MKRKIRKDSYLLVSLVFIGIILSVFIYSFIFSAGGRKLPVPSGTVFLSGKISASSGLSRSFSEIVRFNFRESKLYNPFGLRIFSFFAIQLLLRTGAIASLLHIRPEWRKLLILTDVMLSILLFMVLFWPFISLTAKQLVLFYFKTTSDFPHFG